MTLISNLPALAVTGKGTGNGTSLQGTVQATYGALVALLGKPHAYNDDKTTVVWCFNLNNGESFTVYDWKTSVTPKSEYAWHIGGNSVKALEAFHRFTGIRPWKA
tara:strand:- start:5900 stop:6214 length:315 start_codon:yes stop_codon:yes gene_type:complete